LESVTINIKGTKNNVLTNKMGNFEIKVSSPKITLVFSLVGYQSQELVINNIDNISAESLKINLVSQTQSLNDVVVIGYGTRKRKELTTAVSSVTAKEITQSPVADAAQAIQGKVSGVTIVQGSGAPGGTGGNRIFIRGASSITGTNNPLIVVDGFPLSDQVSDNILNSFSVNDIENIDVLKDAAAASIYGVRGSNGVIIITTKRGKVGKTQVSADIYRGQQEVYNLIEMLNAKDYANLNTQARITGGSLPIAKLKDPTLVEEIYGEGTNWLNEIFRKAAKQSVSLAALGGSESTLFSMNASYLKDDGIIYNTDFERFSVRFNGDIKLNKKFKIGNSISLTKTIEHPKNTYNAFNSLVIEALTSPPTVSPYTATGGYAGGDGNIDGFSEPNPVYDIDVPTQTINKYRITGNIFAELEIIKNLKFKSSVGTDYVFTNIKTFNREIPSTGGKPFATSAYSNERGEFTSNLVENTLTYQNTFNQKHAVTAFIGLSYQESLYDVLVGARSGTFSQLIPELDNRILFPLTTGNVNAYSYSGVGARYISYISRLNYDYDGKYFAMISVRQDGSSNFAPANKFATFPSFSAGWRLSKEKFIENIFWINDLKLRASFGYTGNPNVTPNAYLAQVFQANATSFGQTISTTGGVNTLAPLSPSNPDIKWEKQQQLDIGFDVSLFNNKIGIAFDYFDKISKDLILNVIPPFVTGTPGNVPYNTGEVENKAVDISINASIIAVNNIKRNAHLILTTYTN
ncbi:MAG: SusC/RagA family TonB-linked outer membrane protein, partial [Sediminibacterium sp.]|nr:SusC/RagA family TonB-linked outer membrane protein [Sediminibacterium sp.]